MSVKQSTEARHSVTWSEESVPTSRSPGGLGGDTGATRPARAGASADKMVTVQTRSTATHLPTLVVGCT